MLLTYLKKGLRKRISTFMEEKMLRNTYQYNHLTEILMLQLTICHLYVWHLDSNFLTEKIFSEESLEHRKVLNLMSTQQDVSVLANPHYLRSITTRSMTTEQFLQRTRVKRRRSESTCSHLHPNGYLQICLK